MTGRITLGADLLQANHQGWIDASKTKSTGFPALFRLLWFLNSSLSCSLARFVCRIVFRTLREPVDRLTVMYMYSYV